MGIKQAGKTLTSRHSPLADTFYQLDVLNAKESGISDFPPFLSALEKAGHPSLKPVRPESCKSILANCVTSPAPIVM